jgi:hypothetical protein
MDPTTVIASVNLASKVLPKAFNAIGEAFGPEKPGQNLPESSVSFDKILQAQQVQHQPSRAVTMGERVSQYLSALPELQPHTGATEWNSLGFEIKESGELTMIRADQSRQEIPLSVESKAYLREVYQQTQQSSPPLAAGSESLKLEIAPKRNAFGLPAAGRMLMWKAV